MAQNCSQNWWHGHSDVAPSPLRFFPSCDVMFDLDFACHFVNANTHEF